MTVATDDSRLLEAFKRGETWAEKEIFDRFFEPLTVYAKRLVDDLLAAQDIASDVLIKGIERRQDFPVLRQFRSFLYRSAHNACINHGIAERRHRAIHQKIAYLTEDQEIPETDLLHAEVLQEIYREIENLPDRARAIFKLLFFEDLSTEEIGQRMGINPQTVRTQKARALGLIRTALLKRGRLTALLFFYAWLKLHS